MAHPQEVSGAARRDGDQRRVSLRCRQLDLHEPNAARMEFGSQLHLRAGAQQLVVLHDL